MRRLQPSDELGGTRGVEAVKRVFRRRAPSGEESEDPTWWDPDLHSYDMFVRTYLDVPILRVARRYSALHGLPEFSAREIAIDALTRIWNKDWATRLHSATDERRLATVFSYVGFIALEESRKQRRRPVPVDPFDIKDIPIDDRYAEGVLANSVLAILGSALSRLTDKQREIVELVCIAGLAGAEAARELGISAGDVRTQLNRARNRLRSAIGDDTLRALGMYKPRKVWDGSAG